MGLSMNWKIRLNNTFYYLYHCNRLVHCEIGDTDFKCDKCNDPMPDAIRLQLLLLDSSTWGGYFSYWPENKK